MIFTQSIENFIGNWTLPQVNLDKNPLNATLVLLNEKGLEKDVIKIELYNPKYDRQARILQYDITLLGKTNSMLLPKKFGTALLLISGVH